MEICLEYAGVCWAFRLPSAQTNDEWQIKKAENQFLSQECQSRELDLLNSLKSITVLDVSPRHLLSVSTAAASNRSNLC